MFKFAVGSQSAQASSAPQVMQCLYSLATQLIENWRSRALIARLGQLNDRLLQDAGLDRSDVEWAKQLPLTKHAERALYERVTATHFERKGDAP